MTGGVEETPTLAAVRRVLLVVLVIGMAGTATELLFLRHDEDATQLIPLILIGTATAAVVWHLAARGARSLRALQVLMALFVVAGLLGMFFHFEANMEFQRELDPSIGGMALFWKAMASKAPPALAPGSMSQLGLIGLAYAHRHPALIRPR